MALYEELSRELTERVYRDVLGSQTPGYNFNPADLQRNGDPHAADHGSGGGGRVLLIEALNGSDRLAHDWLGEDPHGLLRETMRAAADRLTHRFGSSDPADWRLENRQSSFSPLGGTSSELIPMTNRASFQQSIAIGQGSGSERDLAKSILPPANTGHVNLWELIASQFGVEPDRLTSQLDRYSNFGYTPHPISRNRVTERADESTRLD
jgi:hypothetical protein